MKTKNNVQKTLLRWAAVFVSFILISFTVSAQDFWKRLIENSSFGNIAMAMVETKDIPAKSSNKIFEVENETETSLALENWMTNESVFSVPSMNLEPELFPENWMFNKNVFLPDSNEEQTLQLEAWMVSESVWKI